MYRGGRITRGRCDEMRISFQKVFNETDRFVMLGSEYPKRVEQAYLNTESSRATASLVATNRAAFLILTKTVSTTGFPLCSQVGVDDGNLGLKCA